MPLSYTAAPQLSQAVTAASVAPIPGEDAVTLLGGLDAGNAATATVATVSTTETKPVGTLPASLYGTAAVTIGKTEYLFGGREGTVTAQDGTPSGDVELGILSYPPLESGAAVHEVAHLPDVNYGLGAATVGGTAYIVGGNDGKHTLDTILSWKPGEAKAKQVKTLPAPLRYAAVTAVGANLVIAGGLLSSLAATRQVLVFDTKTGRLRKLRAQLPQALYAACGATLGKLAYVFGGAIPTASGGIGSETGTIYSINPQSGVVAKAGTMPPRAFGACAATAKGSIFIAGGFENALAINYVGRLTPLNAPKSKKAH
ncbi:MAG TPA: hypothetical protein VL977_03275 [Solirubrobacteraceae bacterium]|nr:hypothetical protein [Solirubrobacteraceae bacterium]